jgi:predicted acyltransferase
LKSTTTAFINEGATTKVSINNDNRTKNATVIHSSDRLLSLDFLRGLIMVSLMTGETGFFKKLHQAFPGTFTEFLATQFEHSTWHGLTAWDVILPAFMTLAGTAMAFSYRKQQESGYTWGQSFAKVLKRSFWLLFWGILIYAVRNGHLNFQLSNVLTQLAFTTLIAFSVINKPASFQLTVSILCLLIPEILFRAIHIPGFDQPFTEFHNFGSYINQSLGIKLDKQHKTNFINFIASGAHTTWGIMAGQLLFSNRTAVQKLKYMLSFSVLTILIGLTLDLGGITPMLKWISTSSFVLVTGGISIIVLALCYGWIDVRKHQNYLKFFTIVGMNSIFIYLFFIFIGDQWLNGYMEILCSELLNFAKVPLIVGATLSCLVVIAIEWYLCYYLYKKKIFFKL